MGNVDDLLERAQDHLTAGHFPEARALVEEAHAGFPSDSRVNELYSNVYLAHGIRLTGLAREARRKEIEARGKPGEMFEDSEPVVLLFHQAIDAFDRVLEASPDNPKAWSLKGQALFRMDRVHREAALAAYDEAVSALERSLSADHPGLESGRRALLRGRRQIERPCALCDDTGFCPECGGGGWRVTLGFRRKCDACLGHGVCKRCGVL